MIILRSNGRVDYSPSEVGLMALRHSSALNFSEPGTEVWKSRLIIRHQQMNVSEDISSVPGSALNQGNWAFMRFPVNVIDVLVLTQLSPFGSQT